MERPIKIKQKYSNAIPRIIFILADFLAISSPSLKRQLISPLGSAFPAERLRGPIVARIAHVLLDFAGQSPSNMGWRWRRCRPVHRRQPSGAACDWPDSWGAG
jgi:hypothetical protein